MISITKTLFFFTFCLLIYPTITKSEYTEADFKEEYTTPYRDKESQRVIIWGVSSTLFLVATRQNTILKIQEDMSTKKYLGEYSEYGDLLGMMIPNIAYSSIMYFHSKKKGDQAYSRSLLMIKASLFSGGTTFFLKRIINQRRPSGNDRNSFPSGHTTTAFAFSSVIAQEHKEWKVPAYLMAGFVGISRINDNAHYIHDVVMGATIGIAYGVSLSNLETENTVFYPIQDGVGFTALF